MESKKPKIELPLRHIEEIYRKPFMCAGFSRRCAEILITGQEQDMKDEIYNRASAWNFQYHNKKLWGVEEGLLDLKILKKGVILGIRLPFSIFNHRKDERGNPARYTHMAVFKEARNIGGGEEYIISHNVGGDLLSENLLEFLQRNNGFVADVFAPKNYKI